MDKKRSVVPIPPSEKSLSILMAKPWLQVAPDPYIGLEGPAFDREGNLFVTSVFDGRIFKISPKKKVSTIFSDKTMLPTATDCAIHKDGRLFIVGMSGQLITMNTEGGDVTEITARYDHKPIAPNGIVFDSGGNFYVTDLGDVRDPLSPTGGVYRFSADLKSVQPIIQNLVTANGISLAPRVVSVSGPISPGYDLWVAESAVNRLVHIRLQEDGITLSHPPANVAYYFSGDVGPDGNCVDTDGNLYQTIVLQGRIVVFNRTGIPVAQVLVSGRDEGKNLGITNVAFKPDTSEAFITTGGWVFTFRGLAEGSKLFSHE